MGSPLDDFSSPVPSNGAQRWPTGIEAAQPENMNATATIESTDKGLEFYVTALGALQKAQVDFLVGGAWAYERYTGIARDTKDLDVFVRPTDQARALASLAAAGYRTELSFPHWLGKAFCGDNVLDVIFSSGNGVAAVDDLWFEHAIDAELLQMPVRLNPVEEMIWSKSFIMERERFDGADVAHLIRAQGHRLDWDRLLRRFGRHWRVLLSHLVLFGFVYPGHRAIVPARVMDALIGRLELERQPASSARLLCQGTLLSREQYLPDISEHGYEDARLVPRGALTADQVRLWTAAINGAGIPPEVPPENHANRGDR
jgi:hypothetical protein